MSHLALAVLLVAIAASACAPQKPIEYGWARVDSKPVVARQFLVDWTVCIGEMQKAALTAHPPEGVGTALQQGRAEGDVLLGCMAQRGYMRTIIETIIEPASSPVQ